LSVRSTNLTRPADPPLLAWFEETAKTAVRHKYYEQFPSKRPSKIAEIDGARREKAKLSVRHLQVGAARKIQSLVFTGEAQQWWRVLAILNLRGPVAGSVEPATSPAGVDLERREKRKKKLIKPWIHAARESTAIPNLNGEGGREEIWI